MAAGRGSRSSSGNGRAKSADPDRIIDAALVLIATQGWRQVSLAAVANEAGVPVLQVYRLFPSRTAILCGFMRRIDEVVLAEPIDGEAGEKPRDRVFDLLMRRFDALQPHRAVLDALRRHLPSDPVTALALGGAALCSMRLMLEAAGISTHGIGGVIAVKLTAATYLATGRTWLRDESPDLALTMAQLDRRLRGIERWLVPTGRSSGYREEAEA
jgi:AcrR family transcriptional regulator